MFRLVEFICLIHLSFVSSLLHQTIGTEPNLRIYRSYGNIVQLYWNSVTLEYLIIRDNQTWLESGPFFIHFNQSYYSSHPEQESMEMSSLYLQDQKETEGIDAILGPFTKLSLDWSIKPSNSTDSETIWRTSFKIFIKYSIIVFEQYFPQNLDGMELGNERQTFKQVSTAFPRFQVSRANASDHFVIDSLGHFTFLDCWDLHMRGVGLKNLFNGGLYSGNPLILFNQTKIDSNLLLSSLTNFMTNFQTRSPLLNDHLSIGLHGRIHHIEADYSLSTILLASQINQGINKIINQWGQIMLEYYGKRHIKYEKDDENDFFVSKLGYYTDTGAYYWYHTESNLTYEQTMINLKQYHLDQQIPVQYYELDSYWYYKQNNNTGEHGGIKLYLPRPDVFPHGIDELQRTIFHTPLIVHHKYYSTDNLYQNIYSFVNGSDGKVALPLDQRFFNKIFSQVKQWGVEILIQDWLSSVYEDMPEASHDAYTARDYHLHLAEGAKQAGIKLIYCMPLNPDILQTLENTQVRYIRISDDYSTNINQWNIGRASMITWALGVIPFKDTFWTTSTQPSSPYGTFTEPNIQLNALIALMSFGGVAISDKIGNTNSSVVNRLCRSDGVLFRPEKPATAMDSTFLSTLSAPSGELWHTFAADAEEKFFVEYVMSTNLSQSYEFFWNELYDTTDDQISERIIADTYIVFDVEDSSNYVWLTADRSTSLRIPASPQNQTTFYSPYHLYTFVPYAEETKWILFGELSKQLPITRQRFQSISASSDTTKSNFQVKVIGVNDERVYVTVGFSNKTMGQIQILTSQCVFTTQDNVSMMMITCDDLDMQCRCQ